MRRIAANFIHTPNETIEQAIVVIEAGVVTEIYPFTHEEAMTEWMSGTIDVRKDSEGILRAYRQNTPIK